MNIAAWHSLFRSEHALITFVGVLVGALLVTRSFFPSMLFAAIGPALITLAAFGLNDYYGYETDKANKRKDRPIVNGEIKRQHALYAALLLFAIGLALTYLVNFTVFVLSFVYVALCFAYDSFLKKLPLLGNAFIALTMAGPFIYGDLAFSVEVIGNVVLVSLIAFFVGLGRELLNTLRDVKGDKKIGAATLPMILGSKHTVRLSSGLFLLAILGSLLPLLSLFGLLQYGGRIEVFIAYALPIAIADLLLFLTMYKALKSADLLTLKQCRNYTLAALACGVVAFLALALG